MRWVLMTVLAPLAAASLSGCVVLEASAREALRQNADATNGCEDLFPEGLANEALCDSRLAERNEPFCEGGAAGGKCAYEQP